MTKKEVKGFGLKSKNPNYIIIEMMTFAYFQ